MNGILLTHGAGGNKDAALLVAVDVELTKLGWIVERVDLAFRIAGGSPRPATSGKDREGLAAGLEALRPRVDRLFLGGHSYGGRQGAMLLAEKGPGFVEGLLLMGYPLHPPGKPEQLRTAHFPELRTPTMFVSGSKDEFGTVEEMSAALALIPGRKELVTVEGARHDLKSGKSGVALRIATEFARFVGEK
jgi:predicted alpha/beta-hydrolase family hydrolase